MWIVATLFVIALLFLAEFDWINRSMIAERQSSALGLTPRYPATNRAHSHLDPVWISEARTWISENSRLKEEKEEVGQKDHEHRVDTMRRIERATLPWLLVRVWMPAIVVRVNLGFDTLDHRGVTRAMLFGLRNEYQKKFLNLFSGYAVLVNFVTVMAVILTVSYVGESAFDFPRVRYVTQEKNCDFPKATKGADILVADQGCAVFRSYGATWSSFFEGGEGNGSGATATLDYCAILTNRLARMPDATLKAVQTEDTGEKVPRPISLRRDDAKYDEGYEDAFHAGNATIPRMLCDSAPGAADILLPFLFAAVVPIDVDPDVVAKHEKSSGHLVFSFLHDNQGLPRYADDAIRTEPSLSLRVYHVLTFLALLALWNWLSRRFSIHPYRATVQTIDGLLQSLDARSTQRRRSALFEPVARMLTHERSEEVARDQLDPRSVELALLDVLEEVRHTERGILGGAITLPVPELTFVFDELDELTFVFDELDKISGVVGAGTNVGSSAGVDKTALGQERRRAYALHQLLSDMKRVISAAPARFIFVGNRLLHDEWTADRSRRQPLLTSIFDTEIYLPSLMLDSEGTLGAGRPQKRLSHRTKEYLAQRHRVARDAYETFVEDRLSPFPLLAERRKTTTSYPQDAPIEGCTVDRPKNDLKYYDGIDLLRIEGSDKTGRNRVSEEIRTQFLRAFCHFLTFRSGGNPKKLQELLNEFVRPAARLSRPADVARWTGESVGEDEPVPLHCEDVLYIHDRSIYRIQLIDTLYMHLVERFEQELIDRDDKVVEAILYLFDFLMKFHGRGFSWSSLERVEDLVYIHRTPDVRAILTRIVEDASERWLHRLLNGMYDFRFRSDFAIELRYLSRLNQAEASALNFTLDEAQGLKATYIALLRETEETGGRRDQEAIAGLGELHEYDQEFGEARSRYLESIDEIDARFARLVGETVDIRDPIQNKAEAVAAAAIDDPGKPMTIGETALLASRRPAAGPVPFMRAVMARDPLGMRVAAVHLPWGIRRLRLMLQVAMTYELSRDLEPAKVHYLDARLFAWSLIEMFPKGKNPRDTKSEKNRSDDERGGLAAVTKAANIEAANDLAKHINLLYQPIFAEAWVSEKLENGIDTACSLVEADILRLRRRLPFLGDLDATKNRKLVTFIDQDGNASRPGGAGHSNMALIGAELHNKAGDLYFYKGKGAVPLDHLDQYLKDKERHEMALEKRLVSARAGLIVSNDEDEDEDYGSGSGMLLRAHYHYAVGLHELRRYLVYRRFTSGGKMNPLRGHADGLRPGRTVGQGEWPTFVPQSIYNNLSDMAESVLARVSFFSLMRAAASQESTIEERWRVRGWKLFADGSPAQDDALRDELEGWFELTDDELRGLSGSGNGDPELWTLLRETFGCWSGADKEGERLDKSYPHLVTFDTIETAPERLATGFALAALVGSFAEKAGYPEDGAREEMLVMELCARYLKWIEITEALHGQAAAAVSGPLAQMLGGAWKDSARGCLGQLKKHLGAVAVHAALRYDDLTWRAWRRRPYEEGCRIGQQVNPEAVTMTCSLAEMLEGDQKDTLTELARKWFGECAPKGQHAASATAEELLRHGMGSFRYPALNQLLARKTLIDSACLAFLIGEKSDFPEDLNTRFNRLREIYEQFGAPLHFTPSMLGETAALIVLATLKARENVQHFEENDWRMVRRAIEALTASRETYSMGRAYYSAIAEMYYLYDDYNDRRVHFNHAVQMAGGELHALLLKMMRKLAEDRTNIGQKAPDSSLPEVVHSPMF